MDKEKRKKILVDLIPTLMLDFRGIPLGEGMIRDDDGIVSDFLKFCMDNEIYCLRGGSSGGGCCVRYHRPDDLEKIVKWFEEQGIKPNVLEQNWDWDRGEDDEK